MNIIARSVSVIIDVIPALAVAVFVVYEAAPSITIGVVR